MLLVERKVILGISVIFVTAIISTVILTNLSTSEMIRSNTINIDTIRDIINLSPSSNLLQYNDENKYNVKEFILIQDEFGFNGSNSGPPIVVNKGNIVKISIINAGAMAHTFGMGTPSNFTMSLMKNISGLSDSKKIQSIPYDVMAKMPCPGCDPMFEKGHVKAFINPGKMVETTFNASESGNFKYFCMVRGHLWLGMNGDLIVNEINSSSFRTDGGGGEVA